MPWMDEADSYQAGLLNHVLYSGDAIMPALHEFWKRILADAVSNARVLAWQSIAFNILERQYEEDEQSYLQAVFSDGSNHACKGVAQYYVKTEHYTCLHDEDEDSQTFNQIQLVWYMEQYKLIKDALHSSELADLRNALEEIRPLSVHAATAFGWFDLQIGQDSFGPLCQDDELLLAAPRRVKPARALAAANPRPAGEALTPASAMQELADALVQNIAAPGKSIHCKITQGLQYGKRALFYEIDCPECPEQNTDSPDERVQEAATALVKLLNPNDGLFPGMAIRLEQQADGNWKNSFELASKN